MFKAFTHLCKKINLSLYDNTLTVYAKSTSSKAPQKNSDLDHLFFLIFAEMNCDSAEANQIRMVLTRELGVYRFVHRGDSDHGLYHQDNFDINQLHWHAQFQKTIDEVKLESILGIFENNSLISAEEHISFMKAYHEANTLPHNLSPLETKTTSPEGDEVEVEQSSFKGFKKGFFLTPVKQDAKPSSVMGDKEKPEEPTFGGFKKGFFLAPVEKTAKPSISAVKVKTSVNSDKEKPEESTFSGFKKGFFNTSLQSKQKTNSESENELEQTVASHNSMQTSSKSNN